MTDIDLATMPPTPVVAGGASATTATRPPRPDRSPDITDRPTLHHDVDPLLPGPPSDAERDLYLGPQHRWVGLVSFLGYVLIVVSVCFFVWRNVWAAALLVPLSISTVGTCVSLVTSSRRRRDTLASHRARVAAWAPTKVPSVDVFLPS